MNNNEISLKKTSQLAGSVLPIIILGDSVGSMIVFGVLNWNKINETANKVKEIDDKVIRQYSTQKANEDKMRIEIDVIKTYIEYHKGYEQGKKEK